MPPRSEPKPRFRWPSWLASSGYAFYFLFVGSLFVVAARWDVWTAAWRAGALSTAVWSVTISPGGGRVYTAGPGKNDNHVHI